MRLFADTEWIKFVGPAVFFVVYLINWLLVGKDKKPAARRAGAPPRPPQPGAPAAQPDAAAVQNKQIQEFLKRAREKPRDAKRVVAAEPPKRDQPKREKSGRDQRMAQTIEQQRRPPAPPAQTQQRKAAKPNPASDAVLARAEADRKRAIQQIAARSLENASRVFDGLTSGGADRYRIKQPSTDRDTRLSDEADARVSSAAGGAQVVAVRNLSVMLKDPGQLQAAFLMGEILNRPEHRW